MKLAIVTCLFTLTSCGQDSKQKTGEGAPVVSKVAAEPFSADVQFSGYVQKAFNIRVNDKDFRDSEDFYTRFIEELVKPSYKDLKAVDVKLEGRYGLDEFGSGSKVYMSSIASDGHLFEGLTNDKSMFAITVKASALDETFKARVTLRIGLEIAKAGTDGLHYCYILSGEKDSIAISEKSKPIIFDKFTTELTSYKCDAVSNNQLIIPDASSGSGSGSADETTHGTNSGTGRVEPTANGSGST